jgi:hypothetical protein
MMPLIDDRGRVFGRVNLIDALVVLFVFLLIPLGYATALLFRVPPPKIISITPERIMAGSPTTIRLTGEDLRPFLFAQVGPVEGVFLVESPTAGEVKLPSLEAGTYDVALYDQARELTRVSGALTVVPVTAPGNVSSISSSAPKAPQFELEVVGAFVGIGPSFATSMRVGVRFHPPNNEEAALAVVLARGTPEPWTRRVRISPTSFASWIVPDALRLPAVLRATCTPGPAENDYCRFGSTALQPGITLMLSQVPSASRDAASQMPTETQFLIDEVRPAGAEPVFP